MTPPIPRPIFTQQEMEQLAGYVAANLAGNGVGKKLDEIKSAVLRLENQTSADHVLVIKHEATLYDNAESEGLVSKVRSLIKMSTTATWALGIVVGMLLATGVGAFVYLVVSHPLSIK